MTVRNQQCRDSISIATASRIIARRTGRSNPRALARLAAAGRLKTTTSNGKTVTTRRWVRDYIAAEQGGGR